MYKALASSCGPINLNASSNRDLGQLTLGSFVLPEASF